MIGTDVTYNHLLGGNPYISKRPKRQQCTFPLALLSLALVGVLLALVERIGMNKTARDSVIGHGSLTIIGMTTSKMETVIVLILMK